LNLHYQPQISLDTGGIIGCEALARWNSNKLGAISPAKFIPVAERSGLIIPLGEKVLKDAIKRLKTWHHTGFEHIYVSVNLSAKQFQDPNLLAKVNHHLAHADLSPEHLELEVTESTAMLDIQQSVKILSEIKKMGISIAMDDFGIE
jgi:EAL domain-containing protein (putative c-di-GMP-specific phosphodiesterase class I)